VSVARSLSATRVVAALVGLGLHVAASPSAAEVVTLDGSTWLRGEILARDLQVLRERRHEGMVVHLDSGGGQLTSAIAIGRLLRAQKGVVRIGGSSSCLSACIFVLAGAPYRFVEAGAVISIHRPHDPEDAQLPAAQREMKQARLDAFVRAYLKEVNVPPALYEAMLNAPGGRTLAPPELAWYGLTTTDRKQHEADRAGSIKR
jgi:hypothetical protein